MKIAVMVEEEIDNMTSARITCIECGRYLGMEEGWKDKCPKCRKKEQEKQMSKTMNQLPIIKFKRLTEDAIIPKYMTTGSVGFDIHANNEMVIAPHFTGMVRTGLAVQIPEFTELTVRQRSGISREYPNYISIGIGTIDFDYRGEIMIPVVNNNIYKEFYITKGMRIAQCILSPIIQAVIQLTDNLDETERGAGGFGSTGL